MQCVTGDYSYDPIFPDQDPDVLLVPDYATRQARCPGPACRARWRSTTATSSTGEPCQFAPRTILRDVMARYERHGLRAGRRARDRVLPDRAQRRPRAAAARARDARRPHARWASRRSASTRSTSTPRSGTSSAPRCDALGIRADTWIHEVGLTQFEINLLHDDPLVVADQAFLFKYAAKEIALKHGMNAVFMAKPIAHQPGSSMHLHQSLVDADGRNVFSDADGGESDAVPPVHRRPAGQPAQPDAAVRAVREFVSALRQGQPGAGEFPLGLRQPHRRPAHPAQRAGRAPRREPRGRRRRESRTW